MIRKSISIIISSLLCLLIILNSSCLASETTKIGIIPSSDSVKVGDEFNITIYIDPTEPIGGWQLDLYFTQGLVNAKNVTSGPYWTSYFDEGFIDNTQGKITYIQTFSIGPYPDINHTACIIKFTAIKGGICQFNLQNIQLTNSNFENINFFIYSQTVTITGDSSSSNGNGNGYSGGSNNNPINNPPIANISFHGPYYGFIGEEIFFNGSSSYDPDTGGNITLWYWDFGDGKNGTGKTITHKYSKQGTYNVTLTVTDDKGLKDTDEVIVIITQPNTPPLKPKIEGSTLGKKNTNYTYNVTSTDADNDTLKYFIDWGDKTNTSSYFISNGTKYKTQHNWKSFGIFNISVNAIDENNATSEKTKLVVLIDVYYCDNIGYLIDNNSDNIYDLFYCNETQEQTIVQPNEGDYLIDDDRDGKWDYIFDMTEGITTYQEKEEQKGIPGFELILTLFAVILILFLKRNQRK